MRPESDTSQRLLVTALALFSEYGYNAVSMRQLANHVGVRSGSLYNYYPSKECLMNALVWYYSNLVNGYDPTREEIQELCETGTPDEVFMRFAYHYEPEEFTTNMQFFRLAHQEQYSNPMLRDWLLSAEREKIESMVYALTLLEKLKKIPPMQFHPRYAATMLARTLTDLGFEATMFVNDPDHLERLAREKQGIFQCFLQMITGDSGGGRLAASS